MRVRLSAVTIDKPLLRVANLEQVIAFAAHGLSLGIALAWGPRGREISRLLIFSIRLGKSWMRTQGRSVDGLDRQPSDRPESILRSRDSQCSDCSCDLCQPIAFFDDIGAFDVRSFVCAGYPEQAKYERKTHENHSYEFIHCDSSFLKYWK